MKQRILNALAAAVLVIITVLPAPFSSAEQEFSFVVADCDVSLYSLPWDQYGQEYRVSAGDILYYCGPDIQYSGYNWYGVLYDGAAVYICARYGTLYEHVSSVRTAAQVALRSGAGTENRQIGTVPSGRTAEILGFNWANDGVLWFRVQYNGQYGYISSRYADPVDPYTPYPYDPATVTAVLTERHMATRSGPSTKYDETGSFYSRGDIVRLYSRVWDSVNEIWWVQAEARENGQAMRVYTGAWRFEGLNVYSLPEEYARYDTTLRYGQTLRMGPGSGYAYYGKDVSAGNRVTVYSTENGWAQIECTVGGKRCRGWVEQSALN